MKTFIMNKNKIRCLSIRGGVVLILIFGIALAAFTFSASGQKDDSTWRPLPRLAPDVRIPKPNSTRQKEVKSEEAEVSPAPLSLHFPGGGEFTKPIWVWVLQGCIVAFAAYVVINQKSGTDRETNQEREKKMQVVTEELMEKKEQLARSIFDQENTIAELNIAFLNLARSNAFKSRLLGMLGHDVLTPIQYMGRVSGQLKTNLDKLSRETIVGTLDEISKTAVQLQLFGESLVQWVRLQAEGYAPVLSEINLSELATEAVNLYHLPVLEKRNTVFHDVDPGITFHHDRTMLKIILLNLLSNANKFTSQGRIDIEMQTDSTDGLVLTVKDNGQGMSTEKVYCLNNLRPTFSSSGTRMETGFGLGYVLIIDLLKTAGGKLNVSSLVGAGTQVMIRLPKAD
jgi:signal transduction histidine kinase